MIQAGPMISWSYRIWFSMLSSNMQLRLWSHKGHSTASLLGWYIYIYRIMYGLVWIKIFFITSETIRAQFSREIKSQVKIIAVLPHKWQNIVTHANPYIILFRTHYIMSWTHKSTKNNRRSLILPLSPRMVFSDDHCDVTTVDLWHYANTTYCHSDFIFVDCSCTCKLAHS